MNISIIGSCHSRDMFNSKFIPDYKDHFNVLSYYTMTSILSVMGNPVKYNYHRLVTSGMNYPQMEHWYYELEKPILKTLESKQPDVLLLDFYADARYGAIAYGGEYLVNRLFKIKGKDIIKWSDLGIVYSYDKNRNDFFTMWKNCFDRFMDFMNKNLPDTQIIINTVKGTNIVTDEEGNEYASPKIAEIDVESINNLWHEFDNYAIKKYGLKAITFEKEYTMDPNYEFGLGVAMVHFHKEYYEDCFKKLIELTAKENVIQKKEVHTNLVSGSSFKEIRRNWFNMVGKYRVVEYDKYCAAVGIDCREELGDYRPQMWSKPIEIDGDGETAYTLSFYIKIPNMQRFRDDSVLFGIRTYKYMNNLKVADAIEEYKLTLEGHSISENEEYRYVYTFKPNGKYVKLAPFMFHYVPGVEYSRVKLERAKTVSEYTK